MNDLPGGRMASRPVHFFWMLDCSGSMQANGKISSLNYAIREALPEMRRAADGNPAASLEVRTLTFSTGARWHQANPVPVSQFSWTDVAANGVTDMGAAFRLVSEKLQSPPMPERALKPVLALVSDGQPTDDWRGGLQELNATPWGKRALRVAIAIGDDADQKMLKEFLDNPELEPYTVKNAAELAKAIRWASTVAVNAASTPRGGNNVVTPPAPPTPVPGVDDDDDEDVW